jgi:hypothetical protein
VSTYFITENEEEGPSPIKIGFSNDPAKRIKTLQTGNPRKLSVMGWISGLDQTLERELHKKYWDMRLNGEWFSIDPSDVFDELKRHSTSSYISIQSNVGGFLGCDRDGIPEYLSAWEWGETELEDFCPQCGWGGGVHYNSALGSENCLECGFPIWGPLTDTQNREEYEKWTLKS